MKISKAVQSPAVRSNKPLTVRGCCDIVDISSGNTIVQFGKHKYQVVIVHCKNCGSVKATSSIKHMRGQENEQ